MNLKPVAKATSALVDTAKESPSLKRSVDNFFYKHFRSSNMEIELMRLEDSARLAAFEKHLQKLSEQYETIPPHFRIEPRRCIIDRACDMSLYYIDEQDLIVLFQHLIVSSADNRYSSKLHPAFIDILQQLSPNDASNLKFFADKLFIENEDAIPLVDYVYESDHLSQSFQENVFLENPKEQDIKLQAVSIENLIRLKLITTADSFGKRLTLIEDESVFEKYSQTTMFQDAKNYIPEGYCRVNMLRGYASLTNLGIDFVTVCLGLLSSSPVNEIQ